MKKVVVSSTRSKASYFSDVYHIPENLAQLAIKIKNELDTDEGYKDFYNLEVAIVDGGYPDDILYDLAADFRWDDRLDNELNELAKKNNRLDLISECKSIMSSRNYIEREGYVEQVWQIEYDNNGFKYKIFVRGTEPEMRAYVDSEMGYVGRYSACTESELQAIKVLRLKTYIAPRDYR